MATVTPTVVSGIFDDYGVVKLVVDELHESGIDDSKIQVVGSKPEEAATLRPEVHPHDTVPKIAGVIVIGGIIGAIFALVVFFSSPIKSSLPIGLFMTFAGIGAGMYIGFLAGAIGKLDIAEDDTRFTEEDMTEGRIWVGVEADKEEDKEVSQQIMSDLGAIRLNPYLESPDEHRLGTVAVIVGTTAIVFIAAVIIMASFVELKMLANIGTAQRLLAFVCFAGLILGSAATAYAGLHSRGARKWLYFERRTPNEDPVAKSIAQAH